ncbi:hypothetical protein L1887_32276 [Cichorium endivia]|nr:hypothetical protein L1887_32276 [Cichorium endivia]
MTEIHSWISEQSSNDIKSDVEQNSDVQNLEGPHIPNYTTRADTAEEALGGAPQPRLTPLDIDKMDNDQIAFTEIQCGIPPELFDLIQNCTTAQQIWSTTTSQPFVGETLRQAFTRFSIIVTRLLSSGAERSNQEINLRFLEGLGKDWMLVKMIHQDSGKLKTYNITQLSDDGQYSSTTSTAATSNLAKFQYQPSPSPQPSIQSKTPTLALPATVQTSESCYSEYDEAEEAAYRHEIARNLTEFHHIPVSRKIFDLLTKMQAPRNYPKEKEEEKVKAFVASGNVEIWSSGDEDEHFENKRKRGKAFGECMMVQANPETPIPGLSSSKHLKDAAESSSSYMPKNYAFMVNNKTGKGVSIIEQVHNMLHTYNIYSNKLEPALEKISNTCVDALAAYQQVLEERDDGYDEVIKLKNRLEDKKIFCDKLTADLKIEQTSRTLLENSNQLLTSQGV